MLLACAASSRVSAFRRKTPVENAVARDMGKPGDGSPEVQSSTAGSYSPKLGNERPGADSWCDEESKASHEEKTYPGA